MSFSASWTWWCQKNYYIVVREAWAGGGHSAYLNMVGNFHSIDPRFWHFPTAFGPFLCPTQSYWLLFCRKKSFASITFSSKNNWPTVGLNFHKNLSFDHFETFVSIFSLIFDLIDPFFAVIRSFWSLIFTKPQIPLGPFFHRLLDAPTKNLVKCRQIDYSVHARPTEHIRWSCYF